MRDNQIIHNDNNNNGRRGINNIYKRRLHFLSIYYELSTC